MQDALIALQQDVNGYLAARYEEGRTAVERLDATEAATAARRPQGGTGGGLWPFGRGSRCAGPTLTLTFQSSPNPSDGPSPLLR